MAWPGLLLATCLFALPAFAQPQPPQPEPLPVADAGGVTATDDEAISRAVARSAADSQPDREDIEQAARTSAQNDARIAAAVSVALARAPAIPDVGVDVNSSVVTLSGSVIDERQRERAERLAKGVQGVAEVDNQLQISTDLSTRMQAAMREIKLKATRLLASTPLLLLALLIVLGSAWLGRFAAANLRWFRRQARNPYAEGLARRALRLLILLGGLLLALDLLGATALVGAVLGSAGVVGLALGFAFRDIAENYIAGIMLSLRRPFAPGDHVLIDGNEGRVVSLSARSTILMTLDGNHLRLPNSLVFKSIILNYTHNPLRRFGFEMLIDGEESIHQAQALALQAICGIDGVLEDPAPRWQLQSYGPEGSRMQFQGWIDQTHTDFGKARSAAIHAVKSAFDEAGIEAPRSVQWLRDGDADSARVRHGESAHSSADTAPNREIEPQLEKAQREQSEQNLLSDEQRTE